MRATNRRLLAGTVALGMVVAGCGSSSSSPKATGGGAVNVMGILTVSSPSLGLPEQADAIRARVQSLNASGGVSGHQIKLTICNDRANPNAGASCAEQAVADHDVAVIGGVSLGGSGTVPILAHAGIPDLTDPVNPIEFTNADSWPVVGGTAPLYAGLGTALPTAPYGCSSVGVVANTDPQSQQSAQYLAAGLRSVRSSLKSTVTTASVTTDYAPVVAQLQSAHVDCAVLLMPGSETVKAIPAFRQAAPQMKLAMASASLPQQLMGVLGSAADGIVLADQDLPPNSSRAGVTEFRTAMQQQFPKDSADALAEEAWGAVSVLAQAIGSVKGRVDAASVSKALGTLDSVDTTVGSTFSFTRALTVPSLSRVFNTSVIVYTVEDGQYQYQSNEQPIDTRAALERAS